jgi:hypothetical protein
MPFIFFLYNQATSDQVPAIAWKFNNMIVSTLAGPARTVAYGGDIYIEQLF